MLTSNTDNHSLGLSSPMNEEYTFKEGVIIPVALLDSFCSISEMEGSKAA